MQPVVVDDGHPIPAALQDRGEVHSARAHEADEVVSTDAPSATARLVAREYTRIDPAEHGSRRDATELCDVMRRHVSHGQIGTESEMRRQGFIGPAT
jgi:hypothetical protein